MKNNRLFYRLLSYSTDENGNRLKLGWISKDYDYIICRTVWGDGYDLIPNNEKAHFDYLNLHPKEFDKTRNSPIRTLIDIYLKLKSNAIQSNNSGE